MVYRSRKDQAAWMSSGSFSLQFRAREGGDVSFDTPLLPRQMRPLNWTQETEVHKAFKITDNLLNSNQFIGTQTMIVRDELRKVSFISTIEVDGIYINRAVDAKVQSRDLLHHGVIRRAHLCLRKFDGNPVTAYVAKVGEGWELYVNGTKIQEESDDIDFPYISFQQSPIGFPSPDRPQFCILTYKCRKKGDIFVLTLDPENFSIRSKNLFPVNNIFGGVDFSIGKGKSLFRSNRIVDNKIVTNLVWSEDFGLTFSEIKDLNLNELEIDEELPANAPVSIDNEQNFHVPLLVKKESAVILIDYHPDDDLYVAAIEAAAGENVSLTAFPSMGTSGGGLLRAGFGDGVVDGAGMIATINKGGELHVANSQSGGYSYAEKAHLNYDMQKAFRFRATECYSRGAAPNMVSMDYVFVESDDGENPLSSELWLETWDMPLPKPIATANWIGDELEIRIQKNGWFFPGQSSFEIYPANTEITSIDFTGWREVRLKFSDKKRIKNAKIMFSTKNVFYYYSGEVSV